MIRLSFLVLLLICCPVRAEDWPRWRGVRGDGTWNAPALPERWPEKGLRTLWKQPIGGGYAGVSVSNGRVYTMDLESPIPRGAGKASDDKAPDGTERVLCFDAATGKALWSHKYPIRYGKLDYANGPRCTPTIHDGKVYSRRPQE